MSKTSLNVSLSLKKKLEEIQELWIERYEFKPTQTQIIEKAITELHERLIITKEE